MSKIKELKTSLQKNYSNTFKYEWLVKEGKRKILKSDILLDIQDRQKNTLLTLFNGLDETEEYEKMLKNLRNLDNYYPKLLDEDSEAFYFEFMKKDNLLIKIEMIYKMFLIFRKSNPFSNKECVSTFYNSLDNLNDGDFITSNGILKYVSIKKIETHPNKGFFIYLIDDKKFYIFDKAPNLTDDELKKIYDEWFEPCEEELVDQHKFEDIEIIYYEDVKSNTSRMMDVFNI